MKTSSSFTDDYGREWEIAAEEQWVYLGDAQQDEDGNAIPSVRITDLRFRLKTDDDSGAWLTLPPWATVRDDDQITLCWFDEDLETGELTYWPIVPTQPVTV